MPPPHPVHRSAVLAVAALTAWVGGCAKKPLPVVKADPSEVEYSGCYEVQKDGPTCYVGKAERSRKLVLHPIRKADRYEVRADGRVLSPVSTEGPAGPILRFAVPEGVSRLELWATTATETRRWTLSIAVWPPGPEWLAKAEKLAMAGPEGFAAAREILDREIARCSDEKACLAALGLRAQIESGETNRRSRIAAFQRAIAAYRAAGFLSGEEYLTAGFVYELLQQHDFALARSTLQAISLPGGSPADAMQDVIYTRGLLAKRLGDFRTAIGEFEMAADLAARMGMEDRRHRAQQEEALMMSRLGRFRDSETLLAKLATDQDLEDPCRRALFLTNRAWTRYLARVAGDWNLGDPVAPLVEARKIYAANPRCTNQPREEFNTELNLALALLESGQIEEARKVIAEAAPAAARGVPVDRLWWIELLARLALKQGRNDEALRLYRDLEQKAQAVLSLENRWRASFGRAKALAALGLLAEAADSLDKGEKLVDQQLNRVPLGGGRESFSDQWSAGSRLYVEVLSKTGQTELALQVARRARGRVLTQLAESARLESLSAEQRRERDARLGEYWSLRSEIDEISAESWQEPKSRSGGLRPELERRLRDSQEALDRALSNMGIAPPAKGAGPLRRPRNGELLLAYFPLSTGQQWVAFCDDGRNVEAVPFLMPSGSLRSREAEEALSRLLLEPFQDKILAAKRLVVLPYGILRTVDFQALPFGGGDKVLLTVLPVVYGLDIPDREPDPSPLKPRAVVVADSRGDLPEARQEGLDIRSSLSRLAPRWKVDLLQREQATAEAVRRALSERVDLLHYAGHADFSGRGGWESQIPLANQSRLTLGDILTLPNQPKWVILSGCETGASDETTQVESQGLAHAFLLSGSRAVVAATRKVNDKVAHELVLEMYKNMGSTLDLATLLQQAQMALKNRGISQREWASFRIFEP